MEEQALQFVTYDEKQLEIAKRFVAIRKSKKVSQQRLSILSGVSYASIRRFEKTGNISLSSLVKLALALQLYDDLDNLFVSHSKYKTIEEIINDQKDLCFCQQEKSWHACIIDLDTAKKIISKCKKVLKIS